MLSTRNFLPDSTNSESQIPTGESVTTPIALKRNSEALSDESESNSDTATKHVGSQGCSKVFIVHGKAFNCNLFLSFADYSLSVTKHM
jgi:hypothetical protein